MNRLNARTKTFETLSAARAHALALSLKFPREYVAIISGNAWVSTVFDWMVTRRTRLNTCAPSDYTHWSGQTGTYWIGGKEKEFSAAQRLQDQIHTPEMR